MSKKWTFAAVGTRTGQSVPVVEVFTLSDGRQFAWAECGAKDGRPVVYLHGAPGSIIEGARSPYSAQFATTGVRLISIERAGYGVSTAFLGRRFIDIVPDVRALADHLSLDPFSAPWGLHDGLHWVAGCLWGVCI